VPTVPNLEAPTVQAEPLPGRAYPRISEDVPSGAFEATAAAGLEQASGEVGEQAYREQIQNDNLRVIDANTQLEAGRNALLYGTPGPNGQQQGGAFSLHGADAIGLPDKLLPEYNKMAANISAGLTPNQQRIFASHIAAGQNELNLQLNRYEYQESNRLANEVYTNGAQTAIEGASVGWRDPAVIGKSRADIKALIQMQGDREGWSPAERNAQTTKLLAEMHYSVVDRMLADGQPGAALKYFVGTKGEPGIRDSNELTGEQAHQLGAAIDAAIRQAGAQQQTNVAAKIRDVRAAAINGQLIPPSAMPSDAELRAAFPDSWQQEKAGITRDIQMGSDLKSFATLTPAQLAQHVESYRPTDVTGAAEGYARYNAAAEAAQRTLADRAKDPRQYAIDNKLGSQPLDFSDQQKLGTELRSRLASIAPLSQQLGGYVPPLTRQEAASLAQSYETMTPADRLRSLKTLSDAIQDDRGFQAVMHQILPASPVTAIVGSQVQAANPQAAPVWFDRKFAADPANQRRILEGEQLINPIGAEKTGEAGVGGKKAFPMPPDTGIAGLRAQFAAHTGNENGIFRGRPELGETYFQAFKGAYASLLAEKGDMTGVGNTQLRDQALRMVLGNQATFHGATVAVPQGMDPSRFTGLFENDVKGAAQRYGAPPDWADRIKGYQVREIGGLGSGRYELVNGNGPLVRPDGKGIFEVNLHDDYLPGRAHGSPEDIARHAQETTSPVATNLPQGQAPPPKPAPREPIEHAPALGLPAARHVGRAHPSQAPTT
jgi:hypothetical protein